jgi:predicted MFS family arabinose efflux permease
MVAIDTCFLQREGIDYLVLKGFTHCPDFLEPLEIRAQYDIDLYSPTHSQEIFDALRRIGYEPIRGLDRFPLDHLPTLVRKTGWQWRADFFDPDLPFSVEVHFRLWDAETERLFPQGLEKFWDRRIIRQEHGIVFTALATVDLCGYASLHLLRHVLRGDPKPLHLYELACFLHRRAQDITFWESWQDSHHASLRQLQAVAFGIAARAFDCGLPEIVRDEIAKLPLPVRTWLTEYGDSPVRSLLRPGKAELWLHMTLLESASARRAVFRRRILPLNLPGPVDAVHLSRDQLTLRIQIRKRWRYFLFVSKRVFHHARTLIPALVQGVAWFIKSQGIFSQFFRFMAGAAVFELGMFVFHLLYSLFLLDIGFAENFLGANAAAMQVGSISGAIPGGVAAGKWGLSRVLAISVALLSLVSALRVAILDPGLLLVLAFIAGMLTSCWMVSIAPVIAELAPEPTRPFVFSIFFSTGIAMGVLGGLLGGHLPSAISHMSVAVEYAKPVALAIGCVLMAAGAALLSRMRLPPDRAAKTWLYPRNPLLWRFLLLVCAFSAGTGAFNPLYAAFLASVGRLSVEHIGWVFALSQFAQVLAIMLGGAAVRSFGLTTSISWMFAGTAAALFCLGLQPAGIAAAIAYIAYMSFQYMSEPGIYSMLISLAQEPERKSASTLHFLTVNAAQALTAFAGGAAIARFGYTPVLGTAALVVLTAAVLFPVLMRRAVDSIVPIKSAQ